jgi:hypothetical protein
VAGLSTSEAASPSAGRQLRLLSRGEFGERVVGYAQKVYAINLSDAWLPDLIKDGLLDGADRQANDRLSPVYRYGSRSYRRALQIARLYSHGITDRAAIRVLLVAKGYADWDIREDLAALYVKHAKSLLSSVRSGYVDNRRDVPAGHNASLMKAFGPLDNRFDEAGLRLHDNAYIDSLRTAKQGALISLDQKLTYKSIWRGNLKQKLIFFAATRIFRPIISGLLNLPEKDDRRKYGANGIEKLIRNATPEQYAQAILLYRLVTSNLFQLIFYKFRMRFGKPVFDAIRRSAQGDPRWSVLILVCGLVLYRYFRLPIVDLAQLRPALQQKGLIRLAFLRERR